MRKRILAIVMMLILGILSPLYITKAYAAKDYSSVLNTLVGPHKGYTSTDDLEMRRVQGQTLTSLNFSGEECVNYAITRLKEKVFGCNISFGIYTGDGKDVASGFINYGYGIGGKNNQKVFTAKDGQQYTVTAYTDDNGVHISSNSLVCFNKNSNKTSSQHGHVVFVEETPTINGIKYVYYTEGGRSSKSWPVKRQTFEAFYNQGKGYTGTVAVIPISGGDNTIEISDGLYTLAPQCAPDARLDVTSGSLKSGANIQIYQNNDTAAQQFDFKNLGDGYYTITAKVSGKLLDIQGGSGTSGANICQSDSNTSDTQKWKLENAGEGWYYIVPKLNNALCLDVDSAGNADGTNVQIWAKNQTNAQRWKLASPSGVLPSNFSVSTDKSSYSRGESVKITPSASNATHYAISVWRGAYKTGERLYANFNFSGGITFNPPQPGTYTIRADAKNSAGYISTERTFTVEQDKIVVLPSSLLISTDKDTYTLGESVEITPSASNATHYAISVWRGAFNTGERLYANFNLSGGISFNPPQPGTYTIRADAKNTAGYISAEKMFTVTAANTTSNSDQGHWGPWSEWSANYVGETSTRQVESQKVKVSDAYTEYRYGRFVDSTGTKVCWCKKYLESWSSVTGSASLQYSDWSTTRYSENGKIWGCGFCGGEHIGVNYVSADGRAWWSQYELPNGYYYWEETRTSEARYETQYRYREWIVG